MRLTWCVPLLALPLCAQSPQDPAGAGSPPPNAPQAMLLPQLVVLPRGQAPITVDGTLTDWPGLPEIGRAHV